MANSNMRLCNRTIWSLIICFLLAPSIISAQGNCLLYPDDSGERIACELSYRAIEYRQGGKDSQLLFDAAIEIGPNYAWAYYEKSVPYFKRGMLAEGMEILNHAVALEPEHYLYYRAYWYFYHRSYAACIADLENLYIDFEAPITFTPGGDLEMRLILAMAYGQSGDIPKGIQSIKDCFESYGNQEYLIGLHDYHLLGVLYYEDGQYDKSLEAFEQQIAVNENLADTYYYLGLIRKSQGDEQAAKAHFNQSKDKFEGDGGGYSSNGFLDYNVSEKMVERKLSN